MSLDAAIGTAVLVTVAAAVALAVGAAWSYTVGADPAWRVVAAILAGWTAMSATGIALGIVGRILSGK